jgi:metallo-beta-lactamase family protein
MLTALILADAAKVATEDIEKQPLYNLDDVDRTLQLIEEVTYDNIFTIGSVSVVFRDAGHILGSGSIEVSDVKGNKIVFSGDLGNTPEDMIRPTEQVKKAEYVIMESTYGDRLHREEDPSAVLQEEINEIEKSKGVLLIPSFSIERAQELLHRINHLKNNKKIDEGTKVFLDSPMAIRATEIFRRSPELYNRELTKEMKTDDPFGFPGLVLTQSAEESRAILLASAPKVIISGSGMMHGGRILHHAINYLSDSKTRLLLVGYQAPGTPGRRLLDGEKKIMIYNQEVIVKANIREVEAMSCHADQKKLLHWLGGIKDVKQVFLTHGEDESRRVLGEKIKEEIGLKDVVLPVMGQVVGLDE